MSTSAKIIISGGGTGGHIFPAIAIADAIKKKDPKADILFVGAEGRMEMEKVPEAGYPIKGLWISGFQRRLTIDNLSFPFKVLNSLIRSNKIINDFKPNIAIGVGGYASGPLLQMATWKGVPTLIQEQNSYPGITNKILSKRVDKICVAYDQMERFFPKEKIEKTGNPIRAAITDSKATREEALAHFDLDPNKPVLFITGGSLGARGINEAVAYNLEAMKALGLQVLWQTGKLYYDWAVEKNTDKGGDCAKLLPFVKRMDLAYAAADILLSRAGALSIAEQQVIGKAVILQPSPNVAEDHQTHNAMALVKKNAAFITTDAKAKEELFPLLKSLVENENLRIEMGRNIKEMKIDNAAERIAAMAINKMNKK